jgi:two-component system sensor histidine kinase DegS
MFDLQPTMLAERGLAPTLQRYVEDYATFFGKRVTLTIEEPLLELSEAEQLAIFRIVQEALQNVQKHASADAADVSLAARGDALCLVIADDGRGFSAKGDALRSGGGAGVPGMCERAKLIGAVLTVESAPGVGTTVTMVLPFRVHDDDDATVGTQE